MLKAQPKKKEGALRIVRSCHQQTKEKVKLLIQLADNLVEKGHVHVVELKRWVSTVDRHYRDFSLRMAKYQESLEKSLGVSSEVGIAHICHPVHWNYVQSQHVFFLLLILIQDNKDLELDIIPASLSDDPEIKLREPNDEVNEEKRKSARKKEWVQLGIQTNQSDESAFLFLQNLWF